MSNLIYTRFCTVHVVPFRATPLDALAKNTRHLYLYCRSVLEIWVVFNMFYLSSPAWFICSAGSCCGARSACICKAAGRLVLPWVDCGSVAVFCFRWIYKLKLAHVTVKWGCKPSASYNLYQGSIIATFCGPSSIKPPPTHTYIYTYHSLMFLGFRSSAPPTKIDLDACWGICNDTMFRRLALKLIPSSY